MVMIVMRDTLLFRNIRYLRKTYLLSRRALAKLVGISAYALQEMEAERAEPCISYQVLRRLCAVFDVNEEDLIHMDMEKAVE